MNAPFKLFAPFAVLAVEDIDLEEAEELHLGVVPDERHIAVVRRDPGDEAEDADQDERGTDDCGGGLDRRPVGAGVVVRVS